MSEEAKQFVYGLQMCQKQGGMKWHGKVPQEVQELFGVEFKSSEHGKYVMGVYVEVVPRFEAFKPEWNKPKGI